MIFSTEHVSIVALIIGVLGLLGGGFALFQLHSLNKLRAKFFAGTNGVDLEQALHGLLRNLDQLDIRQQTTEQTLVQYQRQLGYAIQKVGMVRFNPFDDGGGNFSFCVALLNEHNTGVVITSLHGRQQNRIYSKRIENGQCDTTLTDEENQAIFNAGINIPSARSSPSDIQY